LEHNESPHEYATIMAAVEAYVDDHPEFLTCREFGHAMRPTHKGWIGKANGSALTMLKRLLCRSCGTKRLDEYSSVTRDLIRRSYDYPDGYLLVGMTMTRHDMRSWDMDRALAEMTAAEQKRAA
jgi:hypothetical protein